MVVGGGAAGLAAALRARRHGAAVTLVECGRLGGECTWTGCVPSKALAHAAAGVWAARAHSRRRQVPGVDAQGVPAADAPGVPGVDAVDAPDVDARQVPAADALAVVRAASNDLARSDDAAVLTRAGVTVRRGTARLAGTGVVDVDGQRLSAGAIVLATGSRPALPALPGLDAVAPLTTDDVFTLPALPASMAVLGGGATGVELAQAFGRLGVAVTLVEAQPRLLPDAEPEAGGVLERVFAAEGMAVHTGAAAVAATAEPPGPQPAAAAPSTPNVALGQAPGVALRLDDGTVVRAARVLVATGRVAATEGLGLQACGVACDERGAVQVDAFQRTTVPRVYAVGDVTGGPLLTHAAVAAAEVAVDHALGVPATPRALAGLPQVVVTDPEVGMIGLNEAAAHARHGAAAQVAWLPLRRVDRARIEGRLDGFVKLVAAPQPDDGLRLVGATVVCPAAGELVHEVAVALRAGGDPDLLAGVVHAYPSWAEGLRLAAEQLTGAAVGRSARPAAPGADPAG